jgi:hypothetical protein
MSVHRLIVALITAGALIVPTLAQDSPNHDDSWWLETSLKARSLLIHPATGERHEIALDDQPMGILSPDAKRIAYIGSDPQRVKDGHDFDLFVADFDAKEPSARTNARRLTTDQDRPVQPHWLPDSSGIVFQAGEPSVQQVWYIDLGPDAKPVRLSDGKHRSYDLSITSDARVAWIVHKGSKNKQQFKDLMLHPSLMASGKMRTLIADQHIFGYAISLDGKTLAWSDPGSLTLVNLETSASREIPLQGVHSQLLNHAAHEIDWRPDGKIMAIRCFFVGGVEARDGERPRMFADDKVFFIPVDWTPTAESLKVGTTGEHFPSPMVDDPQAEISPPAGDESKPWWVRELPDRALRMKWISTDEVKARMP